MNIILLFDKAMHWIKTKYRKYIFKCRTKQEAVLIGDVCLINKNIKCGKNVTIYPWVQFWGDGEIVIGSNVDIGTGTIIYSSKKGGVYIGDNTSIAGQCYIIDMDHGIKKDTPVNKQGNSVEKVIIGNDCWIAANVTILKGSNIENGAIVGAKSLVKGRIPCYSVAVGCPAKTIKGRE